MCCFSKPVNSVTKTRIFARLVTKELQAIAYQMRLDAPEDLAMILPIPVVRPAKEDAVDFVNLEKYEDFFKDLEKGFPRPPTKASRTWDSVEAGSLELKVHSVGSFDTSFVPTVADFARLDARFKLPEGTWDKLPAYKNYGFAVFKLKKGNSKIHPMAFTFPSEVAKEAKLYFPTVHIHDGEVHEKEEFDHLLYAQTWTGAAMPGRTWQESSQLASQFSKVEKAKGLIWKEGHVYRREMKGKLKNEDVIALPVAAG